MGGELMWRSEDVCGVGSPLPPSHGAPEIKLSPCLSGSQLHLLNHRTPPANVLVAQITSP